MSDPEASATRTVDFAAHSFARLLFSLLRKRFTGTLELPQPEPNSGERKVWFRGGMPAYTDWVSPEDVLGELLVSKRVISQKTLDEALATVTKGGDKMGQVLLGRGDLDAAKLSTALRLQCANKLVHLFAVPGGSGTLQATEQPDLSADIQGQVNVLQLVHKGIQAHYDADRIHQEMGEGYGQKALASKALARYRTQFGFSAADDPTLRALIAGVSLPELRESYGDASMRIVMCLWACQMLRVGDAAGAQLRTRAPSPPRGAASPPRTAASATVLPPPPGVGTPADSRPPPPPSRPLVKGPPPVAIMGAALPPASSAPSAGASLPSAGAGSPPAPPPAGQGHTSAPSRPATRSRPAVAADPEDRAALEGLLAQLEGKIADQANPFVLFDLKPGVGKREIRGVWGVLSKDLHPDSLESRGLTDLRARAERVFAAVSEAYGVLSNQKERKSLEALLEMGGTGKVGEDAAQLVKNALEAERLIREAERHVRAGHYERSLREYAKADGLNPNSPEIQAGLAYSKFAAGVHVQAAADQALEVLEKIIEDNERLAIAHYFVGMVCVMCEDPTTRAAAAFAEAHRLDPRLVEAQRQLNALRIKKRQARDEKKKKKKGFGGFFGR